MLVTSVDGKIILPSAPDYVRQGKNGWELCDEADAEAAVVQGDRYTIDPERPVKRPPLYDDEGALVDPAPIAPLAYVYDDGGQTISMLQQSANAQAEQLMDLEQGALDLADAQDVTTSETETALVDLADIIATLSERVEALEKARKGA